MGSCHSLPSPYSQSIVMPKVSDIPGIGERAKELLEAAGYEDAAGLAKANEAALLHELAKANEVLGIMRKVPAKSTVTRWLREARKLVGVKAAVEVAADAEVAAEPAAPAEPERVVNYEVDPVVVEMIDNAPVALPLPARMLVERGLGVGDIASAILLNRAVGDLELRVDTKVPAIPADVREREFRPRGMVEMNTPVRRGIDITKLRAVKDLRTAGETGVTAPAPVATGPERIQGKPPERDRLDLLRTPREETNRGRNPSSRTYIRGVLHPHPWKLRAGAMAAIGCFALVPVAVPAAVLLLLSDVSPGNFGWVPWWFLLFPVMLPVFGVLYFTVAFGGKCRICGQKLFVPHRCLRHVKAHHIPVIGYIIPTSLHLLVFQWFRCIFCGTPVRLKE